jgi:hypothetical protein
MAFITNRSLAIIRELLGNNKDLHHSIEAIVSGRNTVRDIDLIFEELNYLLEKKKYELSYTALEDAREALQELRNIG